MIRCLCIVNEGLVLDIHAVSAVLLLPQSAAAFMQSSPWVSRVGVFINLESIGPGGSPIVFQHAGAWVIEAFGKGATHPRGAIAAQVSPWGALCSRSTQL